MSSGTVVTACQGTKEEVFQEDCALDAAPAPASAETEAVQVQVDEKEVRAQKDKERAERLRSKWADKRKQLKDKYGDIQSDGARDALMDNAETREPGPGRV